MLYLEQTKHAVVGSQACVYGGVKGDFSGDDLSVRAESEHVGVCSGDKHSDVHCMWVYACYYRAVSAVSFRTCVGWLIWILRHGRHITVVMLDDSTFDLASPSQP